MGVFNPPPLVVSQGATASTRPIPHVPIPAQGNPPPRYSILPLIEAVTSWPPDLEPRLGRPNADRQQIAPLTLIYGTQPIPEEPFGTIYPSILLAPQESAQIRPLMARGGLVPKPSDQPPRYSIQTLLSAIFSWPLDLEPRLQVPNNRQQTIAPLTLTYGDQPLPEGPLSLTELTQILSTWQIDWKAQTAPPNAGWNIPPLLSAFIPFTTPPHLLWSAWEPAWIQPQQPIAVAPLLLTYGDQPPRTVGVSLANLLTLLSSWAVDWQAQKAMPSAAWNISPIVSPYTPFTPLPRLLWSAWEPAWIAPPPLPPVAGWYIPPPPPPPATAPRLILVDGRLSVHVGNIIYILLD